MYKLCIYHIRFLRRKQDDRKLVFLFALFINFFHTFCKSLITNPTERTANPVFYSDIAVSYIKCSVVIKNAVHHNQFMKKSSELVLVNGYVAHVAHAALI